MENRKRKIPLEVIDDIIIDYSNTKNFIKQKPIEKCDRKGTSIDKAICFLLSKFRSKIFLHTKHVIYQSRHMLSAGLKVSFD